MDPQQRRVAEEFDRYRDNYSDTVNDAINVPGLNVDFFTRVKADYILDIANKHFGNSQNCNTLDIGCGIGNNHSLLRDGLAQISGVDVSKECLDEARRRNEGIDYRHFEGGTLPYDDASFDLTFTICVMHHVPQETWPKFV